MQQSTSGVGRRSGGKGKEGEKMTGMQKRLLHSPMALMWAEDKVRLEIGMPGAPKKKQEQARRWKDELRKRD